MDIFRFFLLNDTENRYSNNTNYLFHHHFKFPEIDPIVFYLSLFLLFLLSVPTNACDRKDMLFLNNAVTEEKKKTPFARVHILMR